MAFTIKQEGEHFVLYDDEYLYDKYPTKEAAEKQLTELELEEKVATAVSEGVDALLDSLKEKFPTVNTGLFRTLIVENLS